MTFEYKCVGAPERVKRRRGVRSRADWVALAMEEIIAAETVGGWEYLRTDLVPVVEKAGIFSRSHEVHRAVMVFRRSAGEDAGHAEFAGPAAVEPQTAQRLAVPQREEAGMERDRRIRLAAERDGRSDTSAHPNRVRRPPTGLG